MNDDKKPSVGDQVTYNDHNVRIMAIAEGWAMVRRKGAMPFCATVKDLLDGKDWIVENAKSGRTKKRIWLIRSKNICGQKIGV